jgi:hypothetical protein
MADKRYPRLDIRVSEEQLKRWHKLAELRGRTLPQLVRELLDLAANKAGVE